MKRQGMKSLMLLSLAGVAALLAALWAQDPKDGLPPDLAWVPVDSAFFLSTPVAEVWQSDQFKPLREKITREAPDALAEIEKTLGTSPEAIERLTVVMRDAGPPPTEPLLLVKTTRVFDEATWIKRVGKLDKKKFGGKTVYVNDRQVGFYLITDQAYAVGPVGEIQDLIESEGKKADGPLGPALKMATGKKHVLAVNVAAVAKQLGEKNPVPDPFQSLLKAKVLTAVVEITPVGVKGEAQMRFAAAADARAAEQSAKAGLELARAGLPPLIEQVSKAGSEVPPIVVEFLKNAEVGLKEAKLNRNESELNLTGSVQMDPKALAVGLAEAVQKVRVAAARAQSTNNLKQIALAMHNYHNAYGNFPPVAVYNKDGKPLLSWRVLILPFVEQDALYKEFKLDEPWDSEHNMKLLAKVPKVFQAPGAKAGATDANYLAFVGKNTLFSGRKGMKIQGITDGTSNTIMAAETAKGVPWSKPDDIAFDDAKLVPRLGGLFPGGFNTAFCDGSVRFITKTIDEDVLRKLITPNGGEVTPKDF